MALNSACIRSTRLQVQNLQMVRNTDIHDDKANEETESDTQSQITVSSNDDAETLEILDIGSAER